MHRYLAREGIPRAARGRGVGVFGVGGLSFFTVCLLSLLLLLLGFLGRGGEGGKGGEGSCRVVVVWGVGVYVFASISKCVRSGTRAPCAFGRAGGMIDACVCACMRVDWCREGRGGREME